MNEGKIQTFLKENQTRESLNFWQTWKKVVFAPAEFFKNIKESEEYALPPFKFIFFYLLFASLIGLPFFMLESLPKLKINIIGGILIYFPLAIILGFIIILFQTLIVHLFFKLFRGAGNLKSTFKVVTYGISPAIIGSIPLLGIIGVIYSLIIMTKGGKRLHEINAIYSFLAIIMPVIISIAIGIALGISLLWRGGTS